MILENITPKKYMEMGVEYNKAITDVYDKLRILGIVDFKNIELATTKGVVSIEHIEENVWNEDMLTCYFVYNYHEKTETHETTNKYDEGWRIVKGNFYEERDDDIYKDIFLESNFDLKKQKIKEIIINNSILEIEEDIERCEKKLKKYKNKKEKFLNCIKVK